MVLPSHLVPVLQGLLDRLIPGDEDPGALAAGVQDYLFQQWQGDCARELGDLTAGLHQLNVEAAARHLGVTFPNLSAAQQDALLGDLEANRAVTTWLASLTAAAFVDRMINLAHEGFYADPGNGGNRNAASWRMVRYDPRQPSTAPPAP